MQTLILGFDSFDPATFERLSEKGKMPVLTRYVKAGRYSHFEVSNPPQTEVSWTSIATGADPGGHGIFDFVHRDPATYAPYVSLLPTKSGLLGTQFILPYTANTIFREAVEQGYPATSLWWPATFPARLDSAARSIPGLGTPDIKGQLGVGILFSTNEDLQAKKRKTVFEVLAPAGRDKYRAALKGAMVKAGGDTQPLAVNIQIEVLDGKTARLTIENQPIQLTLGQWSPILEVTFRKKPFITLHAITRVILTQLSPNVTFYFLPLQIHPLHPLWQYATPHAFVKQTWKSCGPFLSLGWPQDTTGLEEGCITDEQFLALCEDIFTAREGILGYHLEQFREGIIASVFDCLDRIQHMFRRDRPDVVDDWYVKLDCLVGLVGEQFEKSSRGKGRLLILSDHGFSDFKYKVHLNRWLIEKGYLKAKDGADGEDGLLKVDWSRSQAYAVGMNSIYVNLVGREGKGVVAKEHISPLLEKLQTELAVWRGPDKRAVVKRTVLNREAFNGPLVEYGPDIVVGYSPAYRASSETGLGKWGNVDIESNHDHWGADHCIDSLCVPGVLLSNIDLKNFPKPSYRDIPLLAIGRHLEQTHIEPPSKSGGESQKTIEERLKGLGYL